MTTIPTRRSRTSASISALLLTLQALAGGAVPLVHARERETAPAAIEAHHDASCIVLHDGLRCALCQYAGSPTARSPTASAAAQLPCRAFAPPAAPADDARGCAHAGARSRAPPPQLS